MHMSIRDPHFVMLPKLHLLDLLSWLSLVHHRLVSDFVPIFDRQKIVDHALEGKFVKEGRKCVHGSIGNEQDTAGSICLRWEVALELRKLIELALDKPRQV